MTNLQQRLAKINVTEEVAIAALAKICHLGLKPTPEIYAIWYSYFKNDDCDFKNHIDKIITTTENLSEHHFEAILLEMRKEKISLNEFHRDITDVIQETFENAGHLSQNTQNLGEFIHEASEDKDKDIQDIMTSIVEQARHTLLENNVLTHKLEQQKQHVYALQVEYERVREELITDSLTKVHNRRHLDEVLPKVSQDCDVNKMPLSVLMFDIDHFKKFNDTYGHHIGDTVLKFVGQTMRSIFFNNVHNLFRYGGEEFVVLLPGLSKFEASKYAVQLLNAIAKKEIIIRTTGENIGNITISGGIAEKNKRENVTSLIERADIALYESKRKGRNQMTASTG